MLTTLITLFILGILALVAIGIVLAIFGTVFGVLFGVLGFLVFPVAPLLIAGWIVMRLFRRSSRRRSISAADQRWLDR